MAAALAGDRLQQRLLEGASDASDGEDGRFNGQALEAVVGFEADGHVEGLSVREQQNVLLDDAVAEPEDEPHRVFQFSRLRLLPRTHQWHLTLCPILSWGALLLFLFTGKARCCVRFCVR